MTTLDAARWQMGLSLAFHMMFAAIGIGLPLMLVIAEYHALRGGAAHYRRLARKWAKAIGLLFAVGAVSGTALSLELGLLWPKYMEITGAAVGHIFGLEGFAFFIEAIFLGLYLYGRDRMPRWGPLYCAVVIAIAGTTSGVLILGVNAWMQLPVGFTLDQAGRVINSQPNAIFFTTAWISMALHSTLSCYIAVGFAAAGVYMFGYHVRKRRDEYHRSAIRIALTVGGISALLMPVSGDLLAKFVYRTQPAKFAAMEAHFETQTRAPLLLGGIPDIENGTVRFGIHIPGALSFLAANDVDARVVGLNDIPRDLWPPVARVHYAFQVMVLLGFAMMIVAGWFFVRWIRLGATRAVDGRWFTRAVLLMSPAGYVALQAGWIVTEMGRQPWVIQGYLKTADAVTPVDDVVPFLILFTGLWTLLGIITVVLLRALGRDVRTSFPADQDPDLTAEAIAVA